MNLWNESWQPMLLKEIEQPFNSKDYIYEVKFDGIRAIIFVSPKSLKIKSRHNKDLTYLFPELQSLKKLVTTKTIFDGEIILMENNLPSFSKLQTRCHLKSMDKINYQARENPVLFMCFDILYEKKELTRLPLIERKKILDKYPENDYFSKCIYLSERGKDLFLSIKKLGLEGIVAKKKDSLYHPNERTNSWLKIKNIESKYFYIGGYIENNAYTISLLLGEYQKGKLNYVGKVTLGKKNPLYTKVANHKKENTSPFINFNKKVIYINPSLKCKVNFLERTKKKLLRQPFIS